MDTCNFKQIAVVGLAIGIAIMLIASTPVAAQTTSPSDVFDNALDEVFGEIVSIAQIILFAYGMVQVIRVPLSDDRSGPMKQLGISWGIAIVLEGWEQFDTFIDDSASSVTSAMAPVEPLTSAVTPESMNMVTETMLTAIPALV